MQLVGWADVAGMYKYRFLPFLEGFGGDAVVFYGECKVKKVGC